MTVFWDPEVDERDERRDEAIQTEALPIAQQLVGDEEFVQERLLRLRAATKDSILVDVAHFFARFHNESNDEKDRLLSIAVAFYHELKPQIDAAAAEHAVALATAAHDKRVGE